MRIVFATKVKRKGIRDISRINRPRRAVGTVGPEPVTSGSDKRKDGNEQRMALIGRAGTGNP